MELPNLEAELALFLEKIGVDSSLMIEVFISLGSNQAESIFPQARARKGLTRVGSEKNGLY